MIKDDSIHIEFCINFFVSNLNDFLKLLKNHKYILHNNIVSRHIIYENNTNYV